MPMISLADGLAHAREHHYALGAFNVLDSHFLRAPSSPLQSRNVRRLLSILLKCILNISRWIRWLRP